MRPRLWPWLTSNQFVLESEWTFVQSSKKIPQIVVKILRSQEWPGRTDGQMDGRTENIMLVVLVMTTRRHKNIRATVAKWGCVTLRFLEPKAFCMFLFLYVWFCMFLGLVSYSGHFGWLSTPVNRCEGCVYNKKDVVYSLLNSLTWWRAVMETLPVDDFCGVDSVWKQLPFSTVNSEFIIVSL